MSWESNHPSSGGINIDLSGNDDELKKQQADLQLMNDLLERGYSQDSASYIVKKRRETGVLDTTLPTFTNLLTPTGPNGQPVPPNRPIALPPAPDIPERSTLQNFGPMKKKGIMAIDQNNPPTTPEEIRASLIPIPDEFSSVTPVTVAKRNQGQDIYVDAHSGKEIRREPNNSGSDKVIKIGAGSGADASNKPTPAQQAALSYVKDWYKQWQNGTADPSDPVLPSMAKGIGLDISEIPSTENPTPSPTFLQKVFGIAPETPPPTPGKKFPVFPGKNGTAKPAPNQTPPPKYQSKDQVKADFDAGKIDRATAKKILVDQFGHR